MKYVLLEINFKQINNPAEVMSVCRNLIRNPGNHTWSCVSMFEFVTSV